MPQLFRVREMYQKQSGKAHRTKPIPSQYRQQCPKDGTKQTYKLRQAIVEHPFGIVKRQWDFYYIMTKKTIKRASGDVGLVFCAFNLRRIFNILDKNTLKTYLKDLAFVFRTLTTCFKPKCAIVFFLPKYPNQFCIWKLTD